MEDDMTVDRNIRKGDKVYYSANGKKYLVKAVCKLDAWISEIDGDWEYEREKIVNLNDLSISKLGYLHARLKRERESLASNQRWCNDSARNITRTEKEIARISR
jgi:hypothetical protein